MDFRAGQEVGSLCCFKVLELWQGRVEGTGDPVRLAGGDLSIIVIDSVVISDRQVARLVLIQGTLGEGFQAGNNRFGGEV